MSAYIVLILAALSRCLPLGMHTAGIGTTGAGAGVLFFGSHLRGTARWQAIAAAVVMAATDYVLTVYAYGYAFHVREYLFTWIWYAALALFASALLAQRQSVLRVLVAVLVSATGFFLVSNAQVWEASGMYPHSISGLAACYIAALPFYRNDAIVTGILCALLFGLPVVLRIRDESLAPVPVRRNSR